MGHSTRSLWKCCVKRHPCTCKWISLFPGSQCPGGGRACEQQPDGIAEFTWSIVAAGEQRGDRNERGERKTGSPQGWEEGKSEGIEFHFSKQIFSAGHLSYPALTLERVIRFSSLVSGSLSSACFITPTQKLTWKPALNQSLITLSRRRIWISKKGDGVLAIERRWDSWV